jgi:hypothetical protein
MGVLVPESLTKPDHATFTVLQHIVVPEAQDPVSLALKNSLPHLIPFGRVLAAVDLYDDLRAVADEIRDVMPDWHLSAKASVRCEFTQKPPHPLLRICGLASQCSRTDDGNGRRVLLHASVSSRELTPIQLRLTCYAGKASYPSPIKGEEGRI